MTKETYIKMTEPFRRNARLAKSIHITNKIFTYCVFLLYPVLLGYLFLNNREALFGAIVIPMDSFIILSVFRYLFNRPRPYEKFDVEPVIKKDTKGKSFPSRHVFSAFVIAMTYLLCFPIYIVGIGLLVIATGLAIVRVVSGVHFISDVIAGAAFGIISAVIGFIIIL